MTSPQCSSCGDVGRHADGSRIVFCTCAAGARAQEEHIAEMAKATMEDEARMPRQVAP